MKTVIAAAPGFYLLDYYSEDEFDCVNKNPVIAWEIYEDMSPVAVCIDENHTHYKYLLTPEGYVVDRNGLDYKYDDWLADRRTAHQALKAKADHA